ncbi:MAG: glycerol dehydrogenase [archaeon]|nr:glycerol dehydrogenase [archaeon]
MSIREQAWRIFSRELNASSLYQEGNIDLKTPSYIITPFGSMVNRVLISGKLTMKENSGSEVRPVWKLKVLDPLGNFFLTINEEYQSEAGGDLFDVQTGDYVTVIGKVKMNKFEDGGTFINVRPERIVKTTEEEYKEWMLDAAKSMWFRSIKMDNLARSSIVDYEGNFDKNPLTDLKDRGHKESESKGIIMALQHYGVTPSDSCMKSIQKVLRILLPNEKIDLGVPMDINDDTNETSEISEKNERHNNDANIEDTILEIITEVGDEIRGASIENIIRSAETRGINEDKVEEIINSLSDKGLIYEPSLGYIRRIV